jgi:CRISPR/Cas system-associated exonuclease Cas4 (RecB family)
VVYPHKIVDYKTSTQYTIKPKQPNIIQATMCSRNLKDCFGLDVVRVEFQYLRFKKYQYVDVTSELISSVDSVIEEVREGIANDKFPKNDKACWFCDYKLICAAEKKARDKQNKRLEVRKCLTRATLSGIGTISSIQPSSL